MNVLGLIPARGGSKGIPRKNLKELDGKPLVAYPINDALESKYINKVIVSTDDTEVAEISTKYGAEVPFMRPKELAEDKVPDFPVIEHAVLWLDNHNWKVDYIVFLRPTSIFRTAREIDKAVEKMLGSEFDSVRGISKAVYPPYWMKRIVGDRLVPFIESEYEYMRRQELPQVYQGNGTIEVIKRETILEGKSMYGGNIGFIEMDDIATVGIDSELDFEVAESLYPWWQKTLQGKGFSNGKECKCKR